MCVYLGEGKGPYFQTRLGAPADTDLRNALELLSHQGAPNDSTGLAVGIEAGKGASTTINKISLSGDRSGESLGGL